MTSSPEEHQGKRTMVESMKHLCLSDKFADLKFVFRESSTTLHAHRAVLCVRSPVFEAMFCGPLSDENSCEIQIEDTDPDTFRMFLRFIYTDDIDFDGESVTKIMYLANKYNLNILEDKCNEFLASSINVENLCTILEQAVLFEQANLKGKCADYTRHHGEEVLQSDAFRSFSTEKLATLISFESLAVGEKEVFDACVRWAKQNCHQEHEAPISADVIRQKLGNILFSIRFPLIPMDVFVKEVCPVGVLNMEEENQLLKYIAGGSEQSVATVGGFSTKQRNSKLKALHLSAQQENNSLATIGHEVNIETNNDIQLHSLICNAPVKNIGITYSRKTKSIPSKAVHAENRFNRGTYGLPNKPATFKMINDMLVFDPPVSLNANEECTLRLELGRGSSCAENEILSVVSKTGILQEINYCITQK